MGDYSTPIKSELQVASSIRNRSHTIAIMRGEGDEIPLNSVTSITNAPPASFFSTFCSAANRRKSLSDDVYSAKSEKNLVRSLGLFELILLGIGASIGAGIFVVTGTVAHDAGPGVTISFIIAGAACVLNALCYAELSSRFPAVVGGAYLYTYTAFNELMAFLVFAQLMLDYHIGAASIARSLASYLVSLVELFPFINGQVPSWIGHGGLEFFGGVVSINILPPIILTVITLILCRGVKESSALNTFMTLLKISIVIVVIFAGAFKVDVSNWQPFAPNGIHAIVTGATVVFFSYVGFDAVANSAEESKRPQRDLPIAILGSLVICAMLYIAVCLVLTGMVPYLSLGDEAPLAEAFTAKGMKFVSLLISIGAVAGLTTTLLVGLYVQSRLYLGLGRDGLLPHIFSKVHNTRHTPVHSQIWVGVVAGIMAGIFNVDILSHILSVGTLTGYSVVAACVVTLRWREKTSSNVYPGWNEGVVSIGLVVCSGFAMGLCFRFSASILFMVLAMLVAIVSVAALHFRHVYGNPPGFTCPAVPILPSLCIFFNIFLFAQLHVEAWWRFVIVTIISIAIYGIYGQHNAHPTNSENSLLYHSIPSSSTINP